jgi:hypothetical protein
MCILKEDQSLFLSHQILQFIQQQFTEFKAVKTGVMLLIMLDVSGIKPNKIMRLLNPILIIIIISQTVTAQIVITRNDTIQFGNYVHAVSSNNLDSLFRLDTIGTNCIWDISRLTIDKYDTTIVKSARQGKFGNIFPNALYVSFKSNDTINEIYSYLDNNGYYINGLVFDGFCGQVQVMEQTKPVKIMEYPFTLFTQFTDSFTWRNPKCGVFDTITGYYDSSYWEQKEAVTTKAIASGYIVYTTDFKIAALLTKTVANFHIKDFRNSNSDSGTWRITNEFEFTTTEYGWLTNGKGTTIMSTRSWGLNTRSLRYTPKDQLTNTSTIYNHNNQFLKIYPNPIKNKFNIESSNQLSKIIITDARGLNVKTLNDNPQQIEIEHLPKGLYILQAHDEDGRIYTTKFVKE